MLERSKNTVFALKSYIGTICLSLVLLTAHAQLPANSEKEIILPTAGNTWVIGEGATGEPRQGRRGQTWTDAGQVSKTYVRLANHGQLNVWIEALVDADGDMKVDVQGESKVVKLKRSPFGRQFLGTWEEVDSGYISIDLQSVQGKVPVSAFQSVILSGTATEGINHYVAGNEDNLFYFGRRGPSVHLKYHVPEDKQIVYYYNEVTVPEGEDVVGSYYMANGFGGGYFGMQVNSKSERRVLFSVWSPFNTDRPEDIPEDQRVHLLKKGEGVYTGEFGNEGSGGQSYLRYDWTTGNTYPFLLKGEPNGDGTTTYTAWFFAPEENSWRLIASFKRPKTDSYLNGFHSFLENFNPEQGIYTRKVKFANQWVSDAQGHWFPVNKATFTFDVTARKGYRLDYAGGTEGKAFFLKNCGFFNQYTDYGTRLEVAKPTKVPEIELDSLP